MSSALTVSLGVAPATPDIVSGLKIACIGAGYVGGPTMVRRARRRRARVARRAFFPSLLRATVAPSAARAPPPRAPRARSPPLAPQAMIAAKCPDVTVTVCDLDAARIAAWQSAALPIYEPGLQPLVAAVLGRNLHFVAAPAEIEAALAAADVIFVSVNTPTKTYGVGAGAASDLKNVELAARGIAAAARGAAKVVVEKSTVPVRTGETLERILNANCGGGGARHTVLSNPEFLAEGTAVADLDAPSRVLIGGSCAGAAGARAVALLSALYARWVPRARILTASLWSSELSKLVANAMLAQRISSMNSISALCEATGADVDEVARAVGSDARIGGAFLKASVGFGGSCFQKDILNLVYLCRAEGLPEVAAYWEGVVTINAWQRGRFARAVVARLFNTVAGKRLALLGFAFKADTGDARESAAAHVAAALLQERAQLRVHDPQVARATMLEELAYSCGLSEAALPGMGALLSAHDDAYAAAEGAHAVLVLTEWRAFRALDWRRIFAAMAKPAFVFDGRNLLPHEELREIGFEVHAIGKPGEAGL